MSFAKRSPRNNDDLKVVSPPPEVVAEVSADRQKSREAGSKSERSKVLANQDSLRSLESPKALNETRGSFRNSTMEFAMSTTTDKFKKAYLDAMRQS